MCYRSTFQFKPFRELPLSISGNINFCGGNIYPFNLVFRMHKLICQLSVISHKNGTRGIPVQTSNGK